MFDRENKLLSSKGIAYVYFVADEIIISLGTHVIGRFSPRVKLINEELIAQQINHEKTYLILY